MPFLAEELWEGLVVAPLGDEAPDSVHLAGFPEVTTPCSTRGCSPRWPTPARSWSSATARARRPAAARCASPSPPRSCRSADPRGCRGPRQPGGRDRRRAQRQARRVRGRRRIALDRRAHPELPRPRPEARRRVQDLKAALAEGSYEPDDDRRVQSAISCSSRATTSCASARARGSRPWMTGASWSPSTRAHRRARASRASHATSFATCRRRARIPGSRCPTASRALPHRRDGARAALDVHGE